jgi:superfamily I DNA and/or RNA helicase
LVGNDQWQEIEKSLRSRIDPTDYEARRILCGNPAHFQGDERDVIFLSMVDSKDDGAGPLSLRAEGAADMWKKRYNVAASRAKDQLWVIYSLNHSTQLKPGDIRLRLIEHALKPSTLMRNLKRQVIERNHHLKRRFLKF